MARLAMNFSAAGGGARWGRLLLLVAVAVAGCLHALWQREVLLEQLDVQREALSHIETSRRDQAFQLTTAQREDPKAQDEARALVAALQRPWGVMLDAVQAAAGPDLQITRLQPDAAAHRLLVSGQADSSEAFLGLVDRLRRAPEWAVVEPVSQERRAGVAAPGVRAVSFQLALEWRGR